MTDATDGATALQARLQRQKSHVKLSGKQRGQSIQQLIIKQIRGKGQKLQMAFKAWDTDGSNSIDREEFVQALSSLDIAGGIEDYYSLFDAWDEDHSGEIQYTELLAALSGRRYDKFDAFDADISNRESQIAAAALKAYDEAGAREGKVARAAALDEYDRSVEWLRGRWRAARQAVGVALWLQRKAREDGSSSSSSSSNSSCSNGDGESDDDTLGGKSELAPSAHRHVSFARPTSCRHGEDSAATAAAGVFGARAGLRRASSRRDPSRRRKAHKLNHLAAVETAKLCDLALTLHTSSSGASMLAAENTLREHGVAYEHLRMPPAQLLPLLTEMAFARTVGQSARALHRMPLPRFFGPSEIETRRILRSHPLRESPTFAPALRAASAPPAYLSPADATLMVLVARPPPVPATSTFTGGIVAQGDDLSWLSLLPAGVTYHILQTDALDPAMPQEAQTLLTPPPPPPREPKVAPGAGPGNAAAKAPQKPIGAGQSAAKAVKAASAAATIAARKSAKSTKSAASAAGDAGEVPGPRAPPHRVDYCAAFGYLSFLSLAAKSTEQAEAVRQGRMRTRHVSGHRELKRDKSALTIQDLIHQQLRAKGQRVQDIFRRWDGDKSNSISKDEFRGALTELQVHGDAADFDALFDAWDADGGGTLTYTELINALSGARYDAFVGAPPPPPFPPLLVCTPANPFEHNPRFLDDLAILSRLSAAASAAAATATPMALPPYTPLGVSRGLLPSSTDTPSWSRPEIFCDASGAPQRRELLPLGVAWRELFGESRVLPLWLGHTNGSMFAVSREAALAFRPKREPTMWASVCYANAACLASGGYDPHYSGGIGALCMERLWRYLFVPDDDN